MQVTNSSQCCRSQKRHCQLASIQVTNFAVLRPWSTEAMLAAVASNNSLQGQSGQQKNCQLASIQVTNSLLYCSRSQLPHYRHKGHQCFQWRGSESGQYQHIEHLMRGQQAEQRQPTQATGFENEAKNCAQCTKLHGKTMRMTLLPGISWLGHTNWKVLGPWLLSIRIKNLANSASHLHRIGAPDTTVR